MKSMIILLAAVYSSLASAQSDVRRQTSVEELNRTNRNAGKAIEYRANIQAGACAFELFVNDIPVEQFFGNATGTFNTSSPINDCILRSGTQQWKLIVYPGYKDGKPTEALSSNIVIDIEVEGLEHVTTGTAKTVDKPIQLITAPVKKDGNGKETYSDAGKPMAVYEGTFKAQVPYSLPGWSNSKDLSKENPEKLLEEVLSYYREYAGYYAMKDTAAILQAVYPKEKERAQYFFIDENGARETYKDYTEFLSFKNAEVQPIEKYKLKFYGNGRIVTLERSDFPNIGEPVTRIHHYGKNNNLLIDYMFCYLHKRQGSDKFEMIR
ncbi:hypothetical protein [Pedobacter borealis]|uniref:hypothetical protein n=1 Tax=Pedobacter borealis TaxID=475254 RepID=UPI0012F7C9B3|nr:hypothetical protein [Pedobacter borealis]